MPLTTFKKSAKSPSDLLDKLQGQGLTIPDREQALDYLQFVGGYRLKGYWHHLLTQDKKFPAGYSFTDIANRCEFDRELRAATIEAIDRLEVAIRSTIANYLSLKHGPHWFLKSEIFKPTSEWGMGQLLQKIENEVKREKKKSFVAHYLSKHDDPYLPPSWSICECVSFGLWSRTYGILRAAPDKKAISMKFGIDQPEVFKSWIHSVTVLRNVVAHHGQLLKSKLGVAPCNYGNMGIDFANNKYFFTIATVIQYLLMGTNLPNRWKSDIEELFKKYPTISMTEIGFPANWDKSVGWI